MTYADTIATVIDHLEGSVGWIAARAAPDAPLVTPSLQGDRLVWTRIDEECIAPLLHPECIEGSEVSPASLRALLDVVLERLG